MLWTAERQIILKANAKRTSLVSQRGSFPWFWAILISALIFVAENYFPIDVMANENSTDLQAAILQGSIVRQIGYPIIGLIGIVWLMRARDTRLAWRSPLALTCFSLVLWCALSISWAEEPEIAGKRFFAFLLMITGAAGAAAFWSRAEILKFISLSGAANLTFGVVGEIALGNFTPWVSDYRFAGTLTWNTQGFCCLLVALSSLAASDSDRRYKVIFRLLALYGLIFLILTKSRSAMLGFVVGFLVYYLLTRSVTAKAWVASVLSISALVLYMSGAMGSLIGFLSRNGEGADSLTGRVPMWELALVFVKRRPITGYGYHDFWTIANVDYFSSEFHWTVSAAHNGYLETLLTLGYVGLCLHVLVLVLGIIRGAYLFKVSRRPMFALAAAILAVFLVVGILEADVLWSPSPYNFGVTLLLWSLCLEKASSSDLESVPVFVTRVADLAISG